MGSKPGGTPQTTWIKIMKAAQNAAYLDMIDRSIAQLESGKVVTKTMAELEAMESE